MVALGTYTSGLVSSLGLLMACGVTPVVVAAVGAIAALVEGVGSATVDTDGAMLAAGGVLLLSATGSGSGDMYM